MTLFLVGWAVLPAAVVLAVVGLRAWQQFDRMGPGTGTARRIGCRCPRGANWSGLREAVTGVSVVARACPVIRHHPEVRRRMYTQG